MQQVITHLSLEGPDLFLIALIVLVMGFIWYWAKRNYEWPSRKELKDGSLIVGVIAGAIVIFRGIMRRVVHTDSIPIYGFGTMLFVAFIFCTWLYGRRAEKEGVPKERVQDVAIWIFVAGIIGARITFFIFELPPKERTLANFFQIWQGGIVFYGSFVGGWVGYALAYWLIIRKFNLSTWHLADLVAPCVAAGLFFGRLGCFLNGCCFGGVCEVDWRSAHYPMMTAPAREMLVDSYYQTAAGFTLDEKAVRARRDEPVPLIVSAVVPNSPAAAAGLRIGDEITHVNGESVSANYSALLVRMYNNWPRGEKHLVLEVKRPGSPKPIDVAFVPLSRGLHPTQIYESISMFLLFWVLIFVHPLRPHRGFTFLVFAAGYAIHRFLDEALRVDTDWQLFGLTLSQVGSLILLAVAGVLEVYLWRRYRGKPLAPVPNLVPNLVGKKMA